MNMTMLNHGLDGLLLGIAGQSEYAVDVHGEIFRRRASEAGTYGGWRWECSVEHAKRHAAIYPELVALIGETTYPARCWG